MTKSNYGESATNKTEALQQENEEAKEIIAELEAENSHLKELLRECLPIVSAEIMTWQIRGGEESHKRGQDLLTRINTAIGESEE